MTVIDNVKKIDGVELTPKTLNPLMPPTFTNVEDERRERKQKLAAAFRVFGRLGFGEGNAGHITARDPEFPDHFWVNPYRKSFRHIKVSDLILVNHDGDVVYGDQPVNRAGFVLHSAIHKARPDVIAAAHAHSTYGKAFSSLGIPLAPITQDSCKFYRNHTVISDHRGAIVLDIQAGINFAATIGPTNLAAIHQNHGLFTLGRSVDEAVYSFISMERACQVQLAAMAAGTPTEVPHENAQYTADLMTTETSGWYSFQPLFQEICKTDPDLFD